MAGNGSDDFAGQVDSAIHSFLGTTETITGTSTGTINGGGDPMLLTLADNGGSTQTLNVEAVSPLINAGSNSAVPSGLTTDANGNARIMDGIVDIGATEAIPEAASLVVTTAGDIVNNFDELTSLREAINFANSQAGADTITFSSLFDTAQTIPLTSGQLGITDSLIITGPGQELLTVDAQQNSRVMHFSTSTGDLTLGGLTLTGGRTTELLQHGGGIQFESNGTLTLNNSTVSGNSSAEDGGGIYTSSGAVTLNSSTLSGNSSADDGGGIYTKSGAVTLNSSTVSGNSTTRNYSDGGGIRSYSGAVTLNSSTVSGNSSDDHGGGIHAIYGSVTLTDSTVNGNSSGKHGGGIYAYSVTVTLDSSTVSGNNSARDGGGIFSYFGAVTLNSSTVSGNNSGDNGGGISLGSVEHGIAGDRLTLRNSIVAGNSDSGTAPDVWKLGSSANDLIVDYSLIGNTTGSSITAGTGVGNVLDQAALLGPLADNGGPTQTHALLAGSPALNAGDPAIAFSANEFDQRSTPFSRVQNGRVDIGAVETQVAPTADIVDVSPDPRNTSVGVVTINFDEDVTGFDIGDLTLTQDGQSVDISSLALTQVSPRQYTVDLSSVTTTDGTYEFKLSSTASGIQDTSGNALATDASDQFIVTKTQMVTASINNGSQNRSGLGKITFNFDGALTVADANSVVFRNHTTGQVIDITGATLTGNGTSSLTWTFDSSIVFADGRYTAEMAAAGVVGQTIDTFATEFSVLLGDVSGDGRVNAFDFSIVGGGFNPLLGERFKNGDANGDGRTNALDFGVVGGNFNPIGLSNLAFDFGDAPESGTSFATTLANDGARHIVDPELRLGSTIDAEPDGQPNSTADGVGSDEDGIVIGSLVVGSNANIGVITSGSRAGYLNAWIDFNQDGDFGDAGEHVIVDSMRAASSTGDVAISVPASALTGQTYARFRLTSAAGYSFSGLAADGEVEDYAVEVLEPAGLMPVMTGQLSESSQATNQGQSLKRRRSRFEVLPLQPQKLNGDTESKTQSPQPRVDFVRPGV